MRRAVIIAFKSGVPEVISGPEVPYVEQRKRFQDLRHYAQAAAEDGYEAAEMWDSTRGCIKRVQMKPALSVQAPQADSADITTEPQSEAPLSPLILLPRVEPDSEGKPQPPDSVTEPDQAVLPKEEQNPAPESPVTEKPNRKK